MATKTYTFKQYTWSELEANNEDGLNQAGVQWDGLSISDEWQRVMTDADWTDNDETSVGYLTRPWNGHPEGAYIVSDDARPGLGFAVSYEVAV